MPKRCLGRACAAVATAVVATLGCGRVDYLAASGGRLDAADRSDGGVLLDGGERDDAPVDATGAPDAGPDPVDAAAPPDASDGWPATSTRRNPIDVRGSILVEDVRDLPVVVRLVSPTFERAESRADAADLQFVTAEGVTLAHQLERIAPGEIVAWARVPAIAAGVDLRLWVYYGGAAVASPPPTDVWDGSFAAVWHDASGADATAHGHDATMSGTAAGLGVIGDAIDLAGGFARVPAVPPWSGALGGLTASGWVQLATPPPATATLIGRELVGGADDFRIGVSVGGEVDVELEASTGPVRLFGASVPSSRWAHLAMTWDGSTVRAFLDGVESTFGSVPPGTIAASAEPIFLGSNCNGCGGAVPDSDFLDGSIDEIRIATVARRAEWLRAEVLNGTGSLVVVGPAESR